MKETVCILSLPAESRGLGGSPMTRKIQKITPEWQSEPFFCSVGSAVARVKGKHHDGDVNKLGGILCRQFRWYRELFRPVGMKGFFYLLKSGACKAGIIFISLLIRKFIMTYLRSKSTENPKDLRYIRALRYIPAFSAVYPIFISTVKQRQNRTIIKHTEDKAQKYKRQKFQRYQKNTKEKRTSYERNTL